MTIIGYLFGLPQQYFDSSVVPGEAAPADATPLAGGQLPAAISAPSPSSRSLWSEAGATCLTCGIGVNCPGFTSPHEQRQHFKTDWHRYNVQRRLAKQPAISEDAFERVLEQGTEVSISGSESASSSEEDDEEEEGQGAAGVDVVGTARQRRRKDSHAQVAAAIPRVTFQASDGSLFSVWRCLLRQDHVKAPAGQPTSPSELLTELRRLRGGGGYWLVVLLRGGHFAATVFKPRAAANPAKQPDGGANSALEGFDVVAHKTFHRYVVRAKAGGKQSLKDATGKFARSAGSRLRRYNEVALERDVQELLVSWTSHIAAADLLFVHAPASNSRSLFSEGQTALLPSDPRMRRVPFVTHRPTHSETKRVLRLLCAVFKPEAAEQLFVEQGRAHVEEEVEAAAAAAADALAAAHLSGDKSGDRRDEHGTQQQPQQSAAAPPNEAGPATANTACTGADPSSAASPSERPGPAPADAASEPLPAPPPGPSSSGAEGPLHRAAKAGNSERVKRLLEAGHDPGARDSKGRTPYALAADKATRDTFRRFMAQWPDRWDYTATGIPSALTEMEAAQLASKAARKAKLKAKDAERKGSKEGGEAGAEERRRATEAEAAAAAAARKQAVDDEIAQAAAEAAAMAARLNASSKPTSSSNRTAGGGKGSGKVGGGGSGGGKGASSTGPKGNQNAQPAAAAPSAEEVARRREMMAAAAEARMRALTQASQQQKLW